MTESDTIADRLWNEWLDEIKYEVPDTGLTISNREIYQDILLCMRQAFEAGFRAKIRRTVEEMLQK